MLSVVARAGLFLAAFAPATLVLGVRWLVVDVPLGLACIALTALFLLAGGTAYRSVTRSSGGPRYEVIDREPLREAGASFLIGYLLPFVLVDLRDSLAVAGLAIFAVLLAVIWVRSRLLYLNPWFTILGWHASLAVVRLDKEAPEFETIILSRDYAVRPGGTIEVDGSNAQLMFVLGYTRPAISAVSPAHA